MAFKGTLSLSAETFKATVRDYVRSLARHGFRRIAVTWSHGGNAGALREVLPPLAAELPEVEMLTQTDLRDLFKRWMPFAAGEGVDPESLGIHAGEGETSEMLAYAPEQVRLDRLVQGFMGDLISGESEHVKLLQQGLHTLTDNGVLGDARLADRDRGERYLELLADYLVQNLKPVRP
jgi:creatinine amidohydrolase